MKSQQRTRTKGQVAARRCDVSLFWSMNTVDVDVWAALKHGSVDSHLLIGWHVRLVHFRDCDCLDWIGGFGVWIMRIMLNVSLADSVLAVVFDPAPNSICEDEEEDAANDPQPNILGRAAAVVGAFSKGEGVGGVRVRERGERVVDEGLYLVVGDLVQRVAIWTDGVAFICD